MAGAEVRVVNLTWDFDGTGTAHAGHIGADTGSKVPLDRGLDVSQQYQ